MQNRQIVVDGRVFDSEAADRGMGRYVAYLIELLAELGHAVTVTVTAPLAGVLASAWPSGVKLQLEPAVSDPLIGTARLNELLLSLRAEAYLDATPFFGDARYDIGVCPVIAVLYDLIPMRYPREYLAGSAVSPVDRYCNGIARIRKADHVIAISEYVKLHALRYLGVAKRRCTVVVPRVGAEYRTRPARPVEATRAAKQIVCIQGAHRSKNFPAAIRFLEDLSVGADRDVEIIAPTASQRGVIDSVRRPGFDKVHVCTAIAEERKIALQQDAAAVIHLSVDEGYGIPLAEALCVGAPVVCLDNPVNRELLGDCDDPSSAGVLLLPDLTLRTIDDLRAAARFCRQPAGPAWEPGRARVVQHLLEQYAAAHRRVAHALEYASNDYQAWQHRAGLAIAAPTEIGSCGVSDYSYALMRGAAPRSVVLLGQAPRALQLQPQLRLLPLDLVDRVRGKHGILLNLAVSRSLVRGFDAIAEGSSPRDVVVVHDAGSYLPGLVMWAAETGDDRQLFQRYLRGESARIGTLAKEWISGPRDDSDRIFLDMDRHYRSSWLRAFRGAIISHHPAFARASDSRTNNLLALLAEDSEIRQRARFLPMPIDARSRPSLLRLADRLRWALDAGRSEFVVCCAGSVVEGKFLDVVARVVASMAADPSRRDAAGGVMLLLAGRVLDGSTFSKIREHFDARGQSHRLVQIVEPDEARYDGLLAASDVVIAFREQRRIQMSHSYVRALALGRPIITNGGSGFDDQDAALVCRDEELANDLGAHLSRLRDSVGARRRFARLSQQRFGSRHTIEAFFDEVRQLTDDFATVQTD